MFTAVEHPPVFVPWGVMGQRTSTGMPGPRVGDGIVIKAMISRAVGVPQWEVLVLEERGQHLLYM